jgi:hypothetical protein
MTETVAPENRVRAPVARAVARVRTGRSPYCLVIEKRDERMQQGIRTPQFAEIAYT